MNPAFAKYREAVQAARPRLALILGSGFSGAAHSFTPQAEVSYADVPGMAAPTVPGHRGHLAVGHWAGVPVVVGFGRIHIYEGHTWDRVTMLVRIIADCGVNTILITNAAGGIHPNLPPGSLMVIRDHLKLLDPTAWKQAAAGNRPPSVYSPRLLEMMRDFDGTVMAGTYAALTGPCYETPAEIRALRELGADAVGMSTAKEAEAAHALGLEVAGLSCITNAAAGLSAGPLSHGEVEETARHTHSRIADWLTRFVKSVGNAEP